jgi:long-chain acyl-CoA synthetase
MQPARRLSLYSLEDILQKTLSGSSDLISHQSPENTAVILYTTGTTGPKKGVMLSHTNLNSAAENIIRFMKLKDDIIESLPMPFSHSFGFGRLRCVLEVGGSGIIENGFLRPEYILGNLDKYQANVISSVPAGFAILLGFYPDFFRKTASQIKHIEIGSDFMDLKTKKQLIGFCPKAKICMHYGLTEASRAAFLDFSRDKNHLDTAGKPSHSVSFKILDATGKEAKTNNPGEILIQGDIVMKGYWNKPELTAETLKGGWLRTGDSGFLDKNGYLHLLGRKEDIINIRGMKAASGEIEEILKQYKGICDAAVIGCLSGDKLSQVIIKAFIVVEDSFIDFTSLKNHCINHLESYKIPQEFKIIKKIPRSDSGKILRIQLV